MRIRERSRAMEQLYVVAAQLVLQHRGFVFDHAIHAKIQIAHRDVFFGVVICAVKRLVVKTGKMQNRLAHRLAGNGSGVDADAADHGLLFHHGHCFSDFRGLNRGSLPTGAGADDYEIKRSHLRNPELLRRVPRVLRGRLLPHIQYRRLGASYPCAYRIRYRGGTCSPSSPRLQVDPSRVRGCAKVSQAHWRILALVLVTALPFAALGADEDARAKQLDAILAKAVTSGQPGLAVLVKKEGTVLFEKGYGLRRIKARAT